MKASSLRLGYSAIYSAVFFACISPSMTLHFGTSEQMEGNHCNVGGESHCHRWSRTQMCKRWRTAPSCGCIAVDKSWHGTEFLRFIFPDKYVRIFVRCCRGIPHINTVPTVLCDKSKHLKNTSSGSTAALNTQFMFLVIAAAAWC